MSPALLLLGVLTYFAGRWALARCVSHASGAEGFYVGGRESPRPVLAAGMTGTSLSGVTFLSALGSLFAFPLCMTCVLPGFGQPWGGYQMAVGLLLLTGLLTGAGLWLADRRPHGVRHAAS